jgi:hypothetical protein
LWERKGKKSKVRGKWEAKDENSKEAPNPPRLGFTGTFEWTGKRRGLLKASRLEQITGQFA